ncbi:hypothetical protein WN55_10379 [Dufourea novaeangliae]|uniref:Uncharacterized protein n=1 Tax=Dufourea novaeangliae TaxID=178035 RepID=A0A154P5K1_DUFNO|nr:hypothetical protein WN55_10379 [Dufourea novaeangliae]
MMIGGFECPPTALPFGALKSDWARLLLLQKALPDKSVLREKLGRLFRILTIAYFQIEEHFDVTKSIPTTFSSLNASSTQESTISTNSKEETKKNLVTDSRETNEISESLVSTTVFGSEESFDGSGNERTTITSWDVTGNSSERNNSGGLGNNALSTDVAFSPVGVETTSTIRLTSEEVVGDKKNLIDSVLNRNDSVDVTGSMDSIKPVTFPVSESNQVITPLTSNVSILSVEYKSTTKNVEKQEEGITESDFVGGSRFTTELSSSPEIFDVKHTTKQNYIHTDRFSGNDDTSSTKSFPRKQSGHRKDKVFEKTSSGNFPNSAVYRNKIRKPSILRKPPADKEFWKYMVISRDVTLATPTTRRSISKDSDREQNMNKWSRRGSGMSKKRGSLNTNVQNNFRWFYNIGREEKEYAR